MKSKICLCDRAMLKKDLTRFAPLMLLVSLVLWAIGSLLKPAFEYVALDGTPETAKIAMFPAMILAIFSSINLFTYLTKKQECDAMHALPLRRETLLFTKLLVALIQMLIPFGIFYLFFPGDRGWFFQMGVTICLWLYEFGLMTFIMMLVGRRLAGYVLFILISDLGSGLYTVIQQLYLPLLPGVHLSQEALDLSPLSKVMWLGFEEPPIGELLLPLLGCALVGVVCLALALVAYRRRKLERAGDFLAVKWLEPVLAWWMGIYGAIFTISIVTVMEGNIWIALPIGLTIGYFAARMFFARSIKVFNRKTLTGWAALVMFVAASLFVTSLDPLGIVNRVPETDRIESVSVYEEDYVLFEEYGYELDDNGFTATDPAVIGEIQQMHRNLLVTNIQETEGIEAYHHRFYLVYDMKNGSQIIRSYYILEGEDLEKVKYHMSQPENLLGSANLEELLLDIRELRSVGVKRGVIHTQRAFLEVFLEECEAGLMYNPDPKGQSSWDIQIYSEAHGYQTVDVPLSAQKTIAWLEEYFSTQN